jgi:hypothetical protein
MEAVKRVRSNMVFLRKVQRIRASHTKLIGNATAQRPTDFCPIVDRIFRRLGELEFDAHVGVGSIATGTSFAKS